MSSDEEISFKPVTNIDPNVWYQLSEARVDAYKDYDFTSNFQVTDDEKGTLAVWPDNGDRWQFQPVDEDDKDAKGRYSLRSSVTGIKKQLSVCFVEDEIAQGRTQPCLAPSDGSDLQKWEIADWGNSTYRFINVQNGTDYWMDCHKGNPPFMSNNTDTAIYQPAQRWLFSSMSEVNDGGYSTLFTNLPSTEATSTATDTSSAPTTETTTTSTNTSEPETRASSENSNSNSDGGIPVGTAAGVGVGVGVGVILLAALAFFFFWRRRRGASAAVAAAAAAPSSSSSGQAASPPASSTTFSADKAGPVHSSSAWSGPYDPSHHHQPYYAHTPPPPPPSELPNSIPEMPSDNQPRQELNS